MNEKTGQNNDLSSAQPNHADAAGAPAPLNIAVDDTTIRARQRSRSLVTGLVLGGLAILFYAIAIAKMTGGAG